MNIKIKYNLIIFVLIAVSAFVLFHLFKRPLQRLTSNFYYPFYTPISKIENLTAKEALQQESKISLISELMALQKVNEKYSIQLSLLQNVKKENIALKKLYKLPLGSNHKCVFAEVFLRDPALWYETFSINKGRNAGIVLGAVVLARIPSYNKREKDDFAVVGRVVKVSNNDSQVETIMNRNCQLSVLMKNNGTPGILKGEEFSGGKRYVVMTTLPVDRNYTPGEIVVTSGLSRMTTPPGLLIGHVAGKNKVAEIKRVNNLYAEANIEPAVDFDNLRYLIVLIPEKK